MWVCVTSAFRKFCVNNILVEHKGAAVPSSVAGPDPAQAIFVSEC